MRWVTFVTVTSVFAVILLSAAAVYSETCQFGMEYCAAANLASGLCADYPDVKCGGVVGAENCAVVVDRVRGVSATKRWDVYMETCVDSKGLESNHCTAKTDYCSERVYYKIRDQDEVTGEWKCSDPCDGHLEGDWCRVVESTCVAN